MRISRDLLKSMVDHARREAPNECCGMVAARDGAATAVHEMENVAASPLKYEMDNGELFRVHRAIEDADLDLGAIYHSHTRSAPYPSPTDVNWAFLGDYERWPGTLYVIVGLAGHEPEVKAYAIPARDRIDEVGLEVVEAP